MVNVLALGGVAVAVALLPAAVEPVPAAVPPAGALAVDVVTVNGSGCPAGTATVVASSDSSTFVVTYSAYTAQVGVGAKPTDIRKNCLLSLRITPPQGFTYTVTRVDYGGWAHLEAGASATAGASYYFQGSSATGYASHGLVGPLDGAWQAADTSDTPGLASLGSPPCGAQRNLNIDTELRVDAGTSNPDATTSYVTMDTTRGGFHSVYHLAWQQCG
jgi:Domain of unknown function (DUF4360)